MSYAATVLDDRPRAFWRLGERVGATTAEDETGSYDATYTTSPTLERTGALPRDENLAALFDGSNDLITHTALPVSTTTFTIEFWIKPDSTQADAHGTIFANSGGTIGAYYARADQKINFSYAGASHLNTTALTDGVWYHVVIRVAEGSGTFYLNGVADGTFSSALAFTPLYTGAAAGGASNRFKGTLDELAYYDYAFTAAQAAAHYAARDLESFEFALSQPQARYALIADLSYSERLRRARSVGSNAYVFPFSKHSHVLTYRDLIVGDGPQLYLRLGEFAGTIATDQSGYHRSGTYTGTPTLAAAGALAENDRAVTFDGIDDLITHGSLPATGPDFAIEFWIKPDSTQAAASGTIFANSAATTGIYYDRATRKIDFFYAGASHLNTTALTDGVWYHVVINVQNGSGTFHINGAADGTFSSAVSFTPLYTGAAGSNQLKGSLDELAFYKRPLDGDEIADHYLRRNFVPGERSIRRTVERVEVNGTALTRRDNLGDVQANQGSWWWDDYYENLYVHTSSGADPDTFSVVEACCLLRLATEPIAFAERVTWASAMRDLHAFLSAWFRMDTSAGTTIADATGNGRTGTLSGAYTLSRESALADANAAIRFDDTNGRVALTSWPASSTTYTVSFWIKPDSTQTDASGMILGPADAGGGGPAPTEGIFYVKASRKINVLYAGASHLNTTALTDGVWYHVVVSVLAGTGTFYVNGIADGTFTSAVTFTPTRIGDTTDSQTLKGTLDEVAYWAGRALTAADVAALYASAFVPQDVEGGFYDARLTESAPVVRAEQRSPLFGITAVPQGDLAATNADGFFDALSQPPYYWTNRETAMRVGCVGLALRDYRDAATMQTQRLAPQLLDATFKLRPGANALRRVFPLHLYTEHFNDAFFGVGTPTAGAFNTDLNGHYMPIIWGVFTDAPAYWIGRPSGTDIAQCFAFHDPMIRDSTVTAVRAVAKDDGTVTTLTPVTHYVDEPYGFRLTEAGVLNYFGSHEFFVDGNVSAPRTVGAIARDLLELIGVPVSEIDTAAFAQADLDAPFVLQLYVPGGAGQDALVAIADLFDDLQRSTLSAIYQGADGRWTIRVYDPGFEFATLPVLREGDLFSLAPSDEVTEPVTKQVVLRYARRIGADSWSTASQSSAETEHLYNTDTTATVETLLTNADDADLICKRMFAIASVPTKAIGIEAAPIAMVRQIGDKVRLVADRGPTASGALEDAVFEIQSFTKRIADGTVAAIVGDMRGFGEGCKLASPDDAADGWDTSSEDHRRTYIFALDDTTERADPGDPTTEGQNYAW